jgi:hypothetical protein
MKNMLVIAINKGLRIQRKHMEFKPEKHTVIMGNLCDKKTLKQIGKVQRCYSLPYAGQPPAPTVPIEKAAFHTVF